MKRLVLFAAGLALAGCTGSGGSSSHGFAVMTLVSNQPGTVLQDANLVNAWGIAINPAGGAFWISDNGSDKASLYTGDVGGSPIVQSSLVVSIPGGEPTGQVFNPTSSFVVSSGVDNAPAIFIFASESGQITGWNPNVPLPPPSTSAQNGVTVAGAVFKGLAIAGTTLYATDFHNGKVRTFDGNWSETTSNSAFVDPGLPSGFSPFGIANIDGAIYVSYAVRTSGSDDDVKGLGHGIVDEYDTNGNFIARIATAGQLNSPWGMVKAPQSFGKFGGMVLIGNFGDGHIFAVTPQTHHLIPMHFKNGGPVVIDGLWGLAFGNGVTAGDSGTLYFTAGPNDENDGAFGKITVDN